MKRKILSMVMAILVSLSLVSSISVNAMTPQEGADWAIAQIGKRIDTDGRYGAQCVDLIVQYCKTNFGWNPQGSGNAEAYRTVALPNSSWSRIKNTPEFIPQPGDIAIWNPTSGNGYCGHVAIIISANINSFVSVDQNWYGANSTTGSPAAKVTHNYSNFWGVIRPPFSTETTDVSQAIHSSTEATVRDGFFTLKNVASGKFMNVYGGADANGTKITMWEYDNSTDQHFNVVHKGNGKYKLYAACSSNGTNRVVDIYRNGAAPAAGQAVDLWTPDDDTAQYFYVVPLDDGSYVFELAAKDGYVIAPTSASTAGANGSQLTLQKYTGANYQKWKFCNNSGKETYPVGSYVVAEYTVDTGNVNLTLRSGAGTNYSKVASIPSGTVLNVTKISSNWGYTTYGSYSGWVCLDYTVYNPEITSISILNEPHSLTYYVGDELDTTDMVISVNYSNNSTKTIIEGYSTEYDFSTAGVKVVTVEYEGFTTSFEVTVKEAGKAVLYTEIENADNSKSVIFTVSLADAENVYDGSLNVIYDNTILNYKSHSVGSSLSGHSNTVNEKYANNTVRLTFAGTDEVTAGELLSVVFEVIAEDNCETKVKVEDAVFYNIEGRNISVDTDDASGSVDLEIMTGNYTVTSLKGVVIDGSFYAEAEITKNTDRDAVDAIIIAVYKNNTLVDRIYMRSKFAKGQSVVFGGYLEGIEGATLKAFVWDSMTGMKALSNVKSK